MPIRCPKCGYSNDPEFRFCGMCAARLSRQYDESVGPESTPPPPAKHTVAVPVSVAGLAPAPAQQRRGYSEERVLPRTDGAAKRDYSPVNGPSFLGLDPTAPSAEPTPQYLLEDDEPSGHGRLFVGIFLLLVVGGGLFWQWQHEGYPWNPPPKEIVSSVSGDTPDVQPPANADATQPSSPATSESAKADAADSVEKPGASSAAAKDKTESKPDKKSDEASSAVEDKPELKPEPKSAKAAAMPPVTRARREVREPAPEPVDPSEALFVDGQKYLYGSGVPEDCGRARTKLMSAAGQSNAKAQSTVATMYATGHCLPRNLPSAYHWFALALHNDRDNGRLQRDLEMIWGQMTAEEKQMTLKNR